jgi:pyruvate/2-oxoglutarate dehydrogenase complex dihydrolipoamide acyltransferase (E2) component
VWLYVRGNPYRFKNHVGTVGVTSMGMHTSGSAVVVPITPMTLTLSIGSIEKKLFLEDGQVVKRDVIHLNLSADHDLIDGAPLMRFVDRFKKELLNIDRIVHGGRERADYNGTAPTSIR